MDIELKFKKLGVLDEANIKLSPLTVVCGKNNCGKTYLSYALYGLLQHWERITASCFNKNFIDNLFEDKICNLDFEKIIFSKFDHFLSNVAEKYKSNLNKILAIKSERTIDTQLEIILTNLQNDFYEKEIAATIHINDTCITSLNKSKESYVMTIQIEKIGNIKKDLPIHIIKETFPSRIMDLVFTGTIPNVFMISCERTGAVIFKNELNLNKSRLLESMATLISKEKKDISPVDVLNSIFHQDYTMRYALPVKDNVDFVNQMSDLTSEKSYIFEEHPDIIKKFEKMIGGEFKIKDGDIGFVPKLKKTRTPLGLQEASSSVRSLVILWFYLKHVAKEGDLLMIDEPELNLHPETQRNLVRILAQLVNSGINIFITTHSDYFAKEINTMMLLHKAGEEFSRKHGYAPSELLCTKKVNLYVAKEEKIKLEGAKRASNINILKEVPHLADGGLDFEIFDNTIEEMDKVQDAVWFHLFEKLES